ncbi:putative gamma-glutamyltranspeptidase [Rosellinia necatrix]|uniref:Glutathione hydrolase n=1 Tax=Rosellinia necatrix TaxID=77044 RepID=A0A1W2TK90_ROSNE|nr:putative gamma-glutamyltranspeptidase [Rosellinia necatrix]
MRSLFKLLRVVLLLVAAASSGLALYHRQWEASGQRQTVLSPPAVSDHRGAVACESKVCSQIGIDLLAHGGNAVDAFVGAQLCVGVIAMYHSGIGGGGFALIRDQHGEYTALDYRETAPAAAFEDMYKDNVKGSVFGGLAAAVPGELRGLELAHSRFGALPWHDVVYPSVVVARDGFTVTADTIRYMESGLKAAGWNFLVEDPSWAEDFAPNGSLVKLGDTMYRKRYADTLQRIAENGAEAFYTGDIAEAMISIIQANNGTMTLADLAEYSVVTRDPVNITYRGFSIHSIGAPTSGVVGLSVLKTMEGYGDADDANLTAHRFDEAMRFGYAARQELGDPAFVEHAARLQGRMVTASYAGQVRGLIHDNATQPVENYVPPDDDDDRAGGGKKEKKKKTLYAAAPGHGTSHVVTADASGMTVSSTTTINLLFGSLLMVPSTGVVVNNEMNDFSIPGVRNEFGFEPSPANFVRAGKRPLSSITPLIITTAAHSGSNSRVRATVGAAGGSRILSSTTQVAWQVLERGLSMTQAVAAPRWHDQLMPDTTVLEAGFDRAVAESLAARGHNLTWLPLAPSSVQGIRIGPDGAFEAASENRQLASGGLTL